MKELKEISGKDQLWNWFGLSRASFLTIPRVLMHQMPDEWQKKMADLLVEYDETFCKAYELDLSVSVTFKREGKFVSAPNWILNYRHPNLHEIDKLRGEL